MMPHPHRVEVEVSWPVSELETMGVEGEEHSVEVLVMPEWKLPKPRGDGQPLDWGARDNAHPFWGIRRKEKNDDLDNLPPSNCNTNINGDLLHIVSCVS